MAFAHVRSEIVQIVLLPFHKLLSTLDTLSVIHLTLFWWIYCLYLVLPQRNLGVSLLR